VDPVDQVESTLRRRVIIGDVMLHNLDARADALGEPGDVDVGGDDEPGWAHPLGEPVRHRGTACADLPAPPARGMPRASMCRNVTASNTSDSASKRPLASMSRLSSK
jgi:hypothetical protein